MGETRSAATLEDTTAADMDKLEGGDAGDDAGMAERSGHRLVEWLRKECGGAWTEEPPADTGGSAR